MRKWYIGGAILLVLCAAIVVALLNLNALVKRNRDFLLAQAEQALGRKITAGDVELTIMSGIGLQVKDFALADDPSFSPGDFVRAKDLQVNVKIWPLLKREFEIKSIILRQPVIMVSRNALGDFNFSSIGKKEKAKEAKEDQTKKGGPKGDTPGVAIYLANISNGELNYRDQKEGIHLDLKQVDLTVKEVAGGKPISVMLEASLFTDKPNLKLETRIGPILPGTDMTRLRLDGTIEIDPLDMKALQAAVPKLKSLLPKELRLTGAFGIGKTKFTGSLENLAFNGAIKGARAAITLGKNFSKASGIPLELAANAQYANETIYIRNADLKLHTLELNSNGEVHLGDEPTINVSVDAKPSSLDGWEKIIPAVQPYQLSGTIEVHAMLRGKIGKGAVPDVQGAVTLSGANIKPPQLPMPVKNLNSKITLSGQRAETKSSTLVLGNSKIRLTASVEKFSPLTASYTVSTPEIRPADFQAAVAEERKADVFKNLTSSGHLTLQGGNLALQGNVASGDGILRRIAYQRLDATIDIADKVAHLRSLRVNALGGGLTGDGEYAFGESVPRFSVAAKVQGIDINEFYQSLKVQTQRDFHGRLTANAKFAGSGSSWNEIKPNLRGQGDAEIVQGALLNFNLADTALSAAGIPGLGNLVNPQLRKKYPETFEAKDTKFKEMKGHFDVADGRINVKDLRMAAADYSIQGDGWASFERKINFRSALILSPALSADLAQSVREARFLFTDENEFKMPLTVTGTLPRVKTKPDTSALAKMFQRGPVRKDSDAADQEPQKRKKKSTEERILKGLEGLFKR